MFGNGLWYWESPAPERACVVSEVDEPDGRAAPEVGVDEPDGRAASEVEVDEPDDRSAGAREAACVGSSPRAGDRLWWAGLLSDEVGLEGAAGLLGCWSEGWVTVDGAPSAGAPPAAPGPVVVALAPSAEAGTRPRATTRAEAGSRRRAIMAQRYTTDTRAHAASATGAGAARHGPEAQGAGCRARRADGPTARNLGRDGVLIGRCAKRSPDPCAASAAAP